MLKKGARALIEDTPIPVHPKEFKLRGYGDRAFWLDTNGYLYAVDGCHESWSIKYLQSNERTMYADGWKRGSVDTDTVRVNGKGSLNRQQKQVLESVGMHFDRKVEYYNDSSIMAAGGWRSERIYSPPEEDAYATVEALIGPAGAPAVEEPETLEKAPAGNLQFRPSGQATRGGDITVVVDVEALDAAWAKSDQYIGPGGTRNGIVDRYNRFNEWMKQGHVIEQPEIGLAHNDPTVVQFGNGRHRFAALRDAGVKTMPISVLKEFARTVRLQYGASEEV